MNYNEMFKGLNPKIQEIEDLKTDLKLKTKNRKIKT